MWDVQTILKTNAIWHILSRKKELLSRLQINAKAAKVLKSAYMAIEQSRGSCVLTLNAHPKEYLKNELKSAIREILKIVYVLHFRADAILRTKLLFGRTPQTNIGLTI